jgi:hypothetical protein
MTLEAWREAGLLVRHEATPEEIADLLAVAEIDLRDAAIAELSPERKLGCAYGAILSVARGASMRLDTGFRRAPAITTTRSSRCATPSG